MAVTTHPRSGKEGRVSQNGTIIFLKQWEVDDHAESHDSTNFESSGTQEEASGVVGCDVSFSGDWNAAANVYDPPISWFSGAFVTNLFLYISLNDDTFYEFESFQMTNVRIGTNIRGLATVSVTGKSDGNYTVPTGNA